MLFVSCSVHILCFVSPPLIFSLFPSVLSPHFPFFFASPQVQKEAHAALYLFSLSLALLSFPPLFNPSGFTVLLSFLRLFSLLFLEVPWVQVVEDDAVFDCCMAAGVPEAEWCWSLSLLDVLVNNPGWGERNRETLWRQKRKEQSGCMCESTVCTCGIYCTCGLVLRPFYQ